MVLGGETLKGVPPEGKPAILGATSLASLALRLAPTSEDDFLKEFSARANKELTTLARKKRLEAEADIARRKRAGMPLPGAAGAAGTAGGAGGGGGGSGQAPGQSSGVGPSSSSPGPSSGAPGGGAAGGAASSSSPGGRGRSPSRVGGGFGDRRAHSARRPASASFDDSDVETLRHSHEVAAAEAAARRAEVDAERERRVSERLRLRDREASARLAERDAAREAVARAKLAQLDAELARAAAAREAAESALAQAMLDDLVKRRAAPPPLGPPQMKAGGGGAAGGGGRTLELT